MEKDNYLSTAKAIGIILMVVGHAISQNFAYRFIYMFHMPLFFFCSGYFYKVPSSVEGVGRFIIKRFKGLYWPFVKWGIIFLLFHNIFCAWNLYDTSYIYYYNSSEFFHRFKSLLLTMTGQEQLLDPFWFLKQLLLSSLLICGITYVFRRVKFKYVDLLLWVLFFIMAVVSKHFEWGLPVIWNLSIMFLSATFVYMGYIYRKIEKNYYYSLFGLMISFSITLIVVWIRDDYLDMLWYNESNVFIYVPTAFVGIFMTLAVSKIIDRWPIKGLFYYIGKNTLIILVLHLLVFKLVNLLKIYVYGLPIEKLADFKIIQEHNNVFWIYYALFGIFVPLIINEVAKYIKNLINQIFSRK